MTHTHTHIFAGTRTHTHTNEMDELNMGGLCLGGWQGWHKVNDIHYSLVHVSPAKATHDLSPQEVHPNITTKTIRGFPACKRGTWDKLAIHEPGKMMCLKKRWPDVYLCFILSKGVDPTQLIGEPKPGSQVLTTHREAEESACSTGSENRKLSAMTSPSPGGALPARHSSLKTHTHLSGNGLYQNTHLLLGK